MLNGSCADVEVSTLRAEKKRLEELVAGIKNEEQQKANNVSVKVVKELTAQKTELEEKLAGVSAELEHLQHKASNAVDAELVTLHDELQRYKDAAHEQRIRALDLTHELREVLFMPFCVLHILSVLLYCHLWFCNMPYYFPTGNEFIRKLLFKL